MGINIVIFDWLLKLQADGLIGHGETMLELGPQDIMVTPLHAMARLHPLSRPGLDISSVIAGGTISPSSQKTLYAALGVGQYLSSDNMDERADFLIDLNHPVQGNSRQFDLITNFGTAEHVFNVAQVFVTIHQLLKDDGVVLHILPALGDVNHGFWNIHPTVYFDIARDNGYEILDFRYVDNMAIRALRMNEAEGLEDLSARFDFDALPVRIDCSNRLVPFQVLNPHFKQIAGAQYIKNTADPDFQPILRQDPSRVFDYCFVAMRKLPSLGQSVFKFPTQSMYVRA